LLLLEAATLTVIVFGTLAVFMLRRWFSTSRVTVLLFVFCLVALIEGVLLRPYGFFLACLGHWDHVVGRYEDCAEAVGRE
jgi:intracellular septation protein A